MRTSEKIIDWSERILIRLAFILLVLMLIINLLFPDRTTIPSSNDNSPLFTGLGNDLIW